MCVYYIYLLFSYSSLTIILLNFSLKKRNDSTPLYSNRMNQIRSFSKVTLGNLLKNHRVGTPITCITAHDHLTGRLVDSSPEIDMVLIGDSLAMTTHGFKSTVEIPWSSFYSSAEAVSRAVHSKFIIADLPYGSYESSIEKCIESSIALMKMGNVDAVKLEGGESIMGHVKALIGAGIPVCGHLGLQPQRSALLGGYKVQGKTASQAIRLYQEVKMIRDAGVKMVVLECVPAKVAEFITKQLDVLTIGIGAGNGTSGQVLVIADMLGMSETTPEEVSSSGVATQSTNPYAKYLPGESITNNSDVRHLPKFVNLYTDLFQIGRAAVDLYAHEVKTGLFPRKEHTYAIKDEEFEQFTSYIKEHY